LSTAVLVAADAAVLIWDLMFALAGTDFGISSNLMLLFFVAAVLVAAAAFAVSAAVLFLLL